MKRTAYFDNAKAILIYFVVVGHLLSGFLRENHQLDTLYLVIYIFHMPAFILISGHFSKKIRTINDLKKIVKTLVLPYILFQLLYSYYYKEVFNDPIEFEFLEPRYALWFLLSMVMWKLLLSIFSYHRLMIVVSIVLSLTLGYFSEINEWLSLSRTFFFFPFFLMGYFIKREHFLALKAVWNVKIASCLAVAVIIVIYIFADIHWQEWLFGRVPYESIRYEIVESSMMSRLLVYAAMCIGTYIFLSLVPTRNYWFTDIGTKTLGIYLLHLFFIRAFKETDMYIWIAETGNYYILFILGFVIVYILSRNIVWRYTSPLLTFTLK